MVKIVARLGRMALCALLLSMSAAPLAAQDQAILYRGAQVWNGHGFERRDLAIRGGRIIDTEGAGARARLIALPGRYIVPPFANAHVHLTPASDEGSRSFTDAGVFYAMNPNTTCLGESDGAYFARPDTYDVSISQGGISVRGGHPERLYVETLTRSAYPGRTLESFIGDAFHYGESPTEIDASLDLLVRQGAVFVKAYLFHSAQPDPRQNNPLFYGRRGMTPDNFRYLVRAARQRGLATHVHVESAADLVLAAQAGAAMAMHLPGYWIYEQDEPESQRLTDEQARQVAQSGISIVPTYALSDVYRTYVPADLANSVIDVIRPTQISNLRLLHHHRAKIVIGTDAGPGIFEEVDYLDRLQIIERPQLLAMLFATGRAIFPDRRIGCLDVGCEADFLVLSTDPLASLAALRRIERRVKHGRELPGPRLREPAAGSVSRPAG